MRDNPYNSFQDNRLWKLVNRSVGSLSVIGNPSAFDRFVELTRLLFLDCTEPLMSHAEKR